MKDSIAVTQKFKHGVPYDPSIPLLGQYPPKIERWDSNRHLYNNLHSYIIYNTQKVEATQRYTGR